MKEAWIVIPAYNEEKRIGKVIKKAKKFSQNIVVIDDGSKDNTNAVASNQGIIVLRHIVNIGKGAALKTGCDYALKQGAEIIIVMDADGQHDPSKIPEFIKNLKKADVVIGVRKYDRNMPVIQRLGNWFINKTTKFLYNIDIYDTQSGYRAFTKEAYPKIRWQSPDYSMESEMIANIGKHKLKIIQLPIKTIYHDAYKGTTMLDGIKIVLNMLWWKMRD